MKKITVVLCLFSLLLTLFAACDRKPQTGASQTTAGPVQTTAAPAVTTEATSTEPTETGYRAEGSVTAGGVQVYTDPSAYAPGAGVPAVYTRLREGPLTGFEPSEAYGAVYPYAAAQVYTNADNPGYAWRNGCLYGIVDRNGRILTDGIYASVKAMCYTDYQFDNGYGAGNSYQPFWIVSRYGKPVVHEEGENYWTETDYHAGVISMDGSLYLPDDYVSVQALPVGFLCRRDWNDNDFELYDGQGRLCFTGAQVLDPKADGWNLEYGDGLYLLYQYFSGDDRACWFLDATGNRVLGPYQSAVPFREGLACVSVDGRSYGFIDKNGKQVIEAIAQYAASFRNGYAVLDLLDGSRAVIDQTGERLLERDGNTYISPTDWGFRVEGNGGVEFYDGNGTLILSHKGYIDWVDADTFAVEKEGEVRIFRPSGEELVLNGSYYFRFFRMLRDGVPEAGYLAAQYREGRMEYLFIPQDLSAAFPLDDASLDRLNSYSLFYSTQDSVTGEIWYLSRDAQGWTALNDAGEQLRIPLQTEYPELRGDRIMGITDLACVYLDRSGKVVFSYPLNAED